MGQIIFIMPGGKRFLVLDKFGHEAKIPSWFQERPELRENGCWIMKMFDHFCGGNKIIGLLQGGRILSIKMVVEGYGMADFSKHDGQGRAGA